MNRIPFSKITLLIFSPFFAFNPFDLRVSWRQVIELLFSILIISILATIAIPIFKDYRLQAKMSHASGEIRNEPDVYVFHAITGTWAQDNKQLEAFQSNLGFNLFDNKNKSTYGSPYVKSIEIENGAFHLMFKEELVGKTLSMRTAVPEMNPTGPVILVCNKEKPGWILAGKDRTDIDDRLIGRFLR